MTAVFAAATALLLPLLSPLLLVSSLLLVPLLLLRPLLLPPLLLIRPLLLLLLLLLLLSLLLLRYLEGLGRDATGRSSLLRPASELRRCRRRHVVHGVHLPHVAALGAVEFQGEVRLQLVLRQQQLLLLSTMP